MRASKKTNIANGITLTLFLALSVFSLFSKNILGGFGASRYYLLSIITIAFFIIPIIIVTKASGQKPKNALRLKLTKPKWVPVTFFAALTVSLGGTLLNVIFIKAFNIKNIEITANPLGNVSWEEPFAAILAVVILPAILEELYFRGAYISSFGEDNKGIALFAGAFCFAFMHSTPYNFFGPLLAGIVYGFLTLIFNSIYPAIFAHMINNTIYCLVWFYGDKLSAAGLETPAAVTAIILFFVSLYLSLKLIEPFLHKIKAKPKLTLSERRQKQGSAMKVYTLSFYALAFLWLIKIIFILAGVWK